MNEKLTAMYVKASILTKGAKEKVVETVKDVFTDETGEVNMEIFLLEILYLISLISLELLILVLPIQLEPNQKRLEKC